MKKIKVIIIDDSKFTRTLFAGLLHNHPEIEVVATAAGIFEAKEQIDSTPPDVIVLNVLLKELDSIDLLDKVIKPAQIPVIMIAKLNKFEIELAIRAIELWATDLIIKYSDVEYYKDLSALNDQLIDKIKAAAKINKKSNLKASLLPAIDSQSLIESKYKFAQLSLITMIAAGGGSINALRNILIQLPKKFPPIIINFDLPDEIREHFIQRLNNISIITIKTLTDKEKLTNGKAYLVPQNKILTINLKEFKNKYYYVVKLSKGVKSNQLNHVDHLFEALSTTSKSNTIAVLLTGETKFNTESLAKFKTNGGFLIAQTKDSCVELNPTIHTLNNNIIDEFVPLNKIAHQLIKRCESMS